MANIYDIVGAIKNLGVSEEEAYAEFMRDVAEYGADWKLANLMGGLAGAAISLITPFYQYNIILY